jgi:hypothetical protein
MANRFGAVAANLVGGMARIFGYTVYGILRIIYRRKEKLIAIGVVLAILAALIAWWVL